MLRLYTGISLVLGLVGGVLDILLRTDPAVNANCSPHSVICTGGTVYYWGNGLAVAITSSLFLLLVGYPIVIAGRIGKTQEPAWVPCRRPLQLGWARLHHGSEAANGSRPDLASSG